MSVRIFLLAIVLLAILVSCKATAQEAGIDAAIGQSLSSAAIRALRCGSPCSR